MEAEWHAGLVVGKGPRPTVERRLNTLGEEIQTKQKMQKQKLTRRNAAQKVVGWERLVRLGDNALWQPIVGDGRRVE
jgi:hypothetical protein